MRTGQWLVGENLWEGLQAENYADLRPAIFIPSPKSLAFSPSQRDNYICFFIWM